MNEADPYGCSMRCMVPKIVGVALATLAPVLASATPQGTDQLVIYPYPESLVPSPDYQVNVGGKPVFVFNGPIAAIASFDFHGRADIELKAAQDVKWVDVRPLSRGIKASARGNVISFALSRPGNFSIELNRNLRRKPLFLFANPIERNVATAGPPGVHHFAVGQVHKPGVVEVKSGDTVYIAGGAVVQGAVMGVNVNNVTVRGRGILDGTWLTEPERPRKTRLVDFRDSQDIRVEGITLSNSQTWTVVPTNVDRIEIDKPRTLSTAVTLRVLGNLAVTIRYKHRLFKSGRCDVGVLS